MGKVSPPGARSLPINRTSRRILAIWLTRLAIERWRHSENCGKGEGPDAAPFALITETAHGLRIEAVNDAALAAGVHAGMRLADARSLCPQVRTAPADPAGDAAFLGRLALWAQRWGPWSVIDPPDGLLVDITGGAHLFGGEERLLQEAATCFDRQGLSVRLAIAPTAGAAWAAAHFGEGHRQSALLPSGEELRTLLGRLPVAALRLDPDVLLVLQRLGLKRVGDLYPIDRDALQRRFRNRVTASANPLLRLDQILGHAAEPLLPAVAPDRPMAQRRLMEPIRHRPLLDQVVADCADDLARELEARRQGGRRLELALWRVDGLVILRHLELASATRDPMHIVRLLANRLDDVDAGFGIELMRLQALWVEDLSLGQSELEAGRAVRQGTSLAVCIDRLSTRLGPGAVRRPVPYASHVPERAQHWQGAFDPPPDNPGGEAVPTRPLKLLDRAEAIAVLYATPDGLPRRFRWRGQVHDVARVEGPERIAPEWWRESGPVRLRDYYRIEDGAGRRYWIYRHGIAGDGRGGAPLWFLQGLFA
ncbi:DNA polymerase Y family protein [Caenibius sp. WL]|nr:DNA polymerase Y family protein [Caenibius sp. WL]